jgi:hypothetical protein
MMEEFRNDFRVDSNFVRAHGMRPTVYIRIYAYSVRPSARLIDYRKLASVSQSLSRRRPDWASAVSRKQAKKRVRVLKAFKKRNNNFIPSV